MIFKVERTSCCKCGGAVNESEFLEAKSTIDAWRRCGMPAVSSYTRDPEGDNLGFDWLRDVGKATGFESRQAGIRVSAVEVGNDWSKWCLETM